MERDFGLLAQAARRPYFQFMRKHEKSCSPQTVDEASGTPPNTHQPPPAEGLEHKRDLARQKWKGRQPAACECRAATS